MQGRVLGVVASATVILLASGFGLGRLSVHTRRQAPAAEAVERVGVAPAADQVPTEVSAHNLLLRRGEHFRIYVRWLRGSMLRTQKDVNPSFDAPQSFVLEVQKGILSVQLSDLKEFLNSGTGTGSRLTNISLQASGDRLEMLGTAHKIIPIPVKISGILAPLPDGRLQFHVLGISLLKVPMKRFLGLFSIKLNDLVASPKTHGVEIVGNDVRFDTEALLPPPHIHGRITNVVMSPNELKIIYGGAGDQEDQLTQWHNYFRFAGGTLNFGKLTMHDVDLTMIDASKHPWFDLDLVNYQAQLVNGYTRITAKAGMEIYMPSLEDIKSKDAVQAVSLEWLKNRNSSMPSDVPFKNGKPVGP